MKTAVVISDSHGRCAALEQMEKILAENDLVIHLGDGFRDVLRFVRNSPQMPQKLYLCRGNCDFSYAEDEFVLTVEGVRIFCCHGHRYGVKTGRDLLAARARELDCTVALYGHTHVAKEEEIGGVLCLNPGSLGDFVSPSYAYLAVSGGKLTHVLVPLNG